jgi:hypothetical protein
MPNNLTLTSWMEMITVTNDDNKRPAVMVPSPFGVYENGIKIENSGPAEIETAWPGYVDPITGYTLELVVAEQVGMKLEGDIELLELMDKIDEQGDMMERLVEYVRDSTADYITELAMNKEERTVSTQDDIIKRLITLITDLGVMVGEDGGDLDDEQITQAEQAWAEFESMNDELQPWIEQLPQGI